MCSRYDPNRGWWDVLVASAAKCAESSPVQDTPCQVWEGVWWFLSLRDLPHILGCPAGTLLDECDTAFTRPSLLNIAQLFPLVHGGTASYINLGTYQICVRAHLALFDRTAFSLTAGRKLSTWAWVVSSGARSGPFAGVRLGSSAKSPPQKATRFRSCWCSSQDQ